MNFEAANTRAAVAGKFKRCYDVNTSAELDKRRERSQDFAGFFHTQVGNITPIRRFLMNLFQTILSSDENTYKADEIKQIH